MKRQREMQRQRKRERKREKKRQRKRQRQRQREREREGREREGSVECRCHMGTLMAHGKAHGSREVYSHMPVHGLYPAVSASCLHRYI